MHQIIHAHGQADDHKTSVHGLTSLHSSTSFARRLAEADVASIKQCAQCAITNGHVHLKTAESIFNKCKVRPSIHNPYILNAKTSDLPVREKISKCVLEEVHRLLSRKHVSESTCASSCQVTQNWSTSQSSIPIALLAAERRVLHSSFF